MSAPALGDSREQAQDLDRRDPLARWRSSFHLPLGTDGQPLIYLCGNSLGLQPHGVRAALEQELLDWQRMGVAGHFDAARPWFSYHEHFAESVAALVGAASSEVVLMNSLTANLHLMMASFYRPTSERACILIDEPAFPSDRYAVESQIRWHGLDPADALLVARPHPPYATLRMQDVEEILRHEGRRVALVLLAGVNYLTGQVLDFSRVTAWARQQGCQVGWDLAHAVGNVPLRLHDWDVDFAVWCSYKYLNCGPGAVGGCFVHERHGQRTDLPRLAGWWGNDPAVRFQMPERFEAQAGAAGWQLSNAPVLSMAACAPSLRLFDQVGMAALREKSERLTGFLLELLDRLPSDRLQVITPRAKEERGCQLSLRISTGARAVAEALERRGVVCDFREPDVIRVAPVPFYNTFEEVWRFASIMAELI